MIQLNLYPNQKNKILVLCILLGTLIGCDTQRKDPITLESKNGSVMVDHSVIEIDGCEYIESIGSKRYGLTHKGNCKYCKNTKMR